MQITVLGSGPACPRPGGASAGYLVQSKGRPVLVDCGHGIAGRIQTAVSLSELAAVVVSHMHPDHYWDLVALKYGLQWAGRSGVPLHLPPGGWPYLRGLETTVLGSDTFFAEVYTVAEYNPASTLEVEGLAVRFAATTHLMPGCAMRFGDGGDRRRDVFYSGDTSPNEAITALARRVKLAVVECSFLDDVERAELTGHMTAARAASLARDADAGGLLLTHYGASDAERVAGAARDVFEGPVQLAVEGETYLT